MRNELLFLRVLVLVLLVLTVLSLILDIWIFLRQGLVHTHLKGNLRVYKHDFGCPVVAVSWLVGQIGRSQILRASVYRGAWLNRPAHSLPCMGLVSSKGMMGKLQGCIFFTMNLTAIVKIKLHCQLK